MLNKVLITAVFVCFAVSVSNAANTIYVDAASPNDPGTGASEDPFRRIQDGIDYAVSGDTVVIHPGIYTGPGNYDLDPNGKSIIICSNDPNDPDITAQTIIDPNQAGRGFYIHTGEDANCAIAGLTIRNAYTAEIGAGICCTQSNPTIINCSLVGNHAEGYGGAVFCEESNSLFERCTISNNYAYDGGGVSISSGYLHLMHCIISNNHVTRYGGGVDCYQGNFGLTNCSLINNKTGTGGAGGAICLWGSDANIKNSILWANEATTGTQLYLHIESSISVSYGDVQGGISDVCATDSNVNWGSGNIDSDPCFVSFDPNGDPNLWDLHLQSKDGRWNSALYKIDLNNDGTINLVEFARLADVWLQDASLLEDLDNSGMVDLLDLGLFVQYYLANSDEDGWIPDATTSPCIDAGDPNSDWTAEPWPNGKRINMGAYGGTEEASKNGNLADFDVNGTVNFLDLMEFCSKWLIEDSDIVNLDLTGSVDFRDFAILAENWLWEK